MVDSANSQEASINNKDLHFSSSSKDRALLFKINKSVDSIKDKDLLSRIRIKVGLVDSRHLHFSSNNKDCRVRLFKDK